MMVTEPGKWRLQRVVKFKIQGMFWRYDKLARLAG